MAASTVRPKLGIVNIVGAMAVHAALAGFSHRRERAAVAVVAGDVDMSAIQFKVRLHIVVKQPQVPRDRVVA